MNYNKLYNNILSAINEGLQETLLNNDDIIVDWADDNAQIYCNGGDATLCSEQINYYRELEDDEYELVILYVPEDKRRMGIGSKILSKVQEIADKT